MSAFVLAEAGWRRSERAISLNLCTHRFLHRWPYESQEERGPRLPHPIVNVRCPSRTSSQARYQMSTFPIWPPRAPAEPVHTSRETRRSGAGNKWTTSATQGLGKHGYAGSSKCARFQPLPHLRAWCRINTLIVSASTGKDTRTSKLQFFQATG